MKYVRRFPECIGAHTIALFIEIHTKKQFSGTIFYDNLIIVPGHGKTFSPVPNRLFTGEYFL